ncbi:MAG: SPFH domain-containing protein [Chloroflexota bacterium]
MLTPPESLTLDVVLRLLSQVVWGIYILYVILIYINTLRRHGFVIALIRLVSAQVILPLLIPISFMLFTISLVFVPPQQVAVIISVLSPGGVRPQPMPAGLHFIIPVLEWEQRYPIYWQTYTMASIPFEGTVEGDDSIIARTRDGQEVRLDTSIIFRIDEQQAVSVHVEWQDRYITELVRPVIRGRLRLQVSQFTVQEVNSEKRKDLEAAVARELVEEFSSKGLIVDQFILRGISFTDEYARSIEAKQIALEEREMAIYEAQRIEFLAEGDAKAARERAKGDADAIRIRAEGEADGIRIQAKAEEEALKFIASALNENDQLITYRYVDKLAPNIQIMLVPNESPLILPVPEFRTPEVEHSSTVMPDTAATPMSTITPMPTITTISEPPPAETPSTETPPTETQPSTTESTNTENGSIEGTRTVPSTERQPLATPAATPTPVTENIQEAN